MLDQPKLNLLRAHEIMKKSADGHSRDVEFDVGAMVYLKLKPYRQQYVVRCVCQTLAAKLFGPFQVLARVWPFQLPASSKIHPVFHVSQLKLALGSCVEVQPLPLETLKEVDNIILPDDVLAKPYDSEGRLELLVKWEQCPTHENSWMLYEELVEHYPHFKFEEKLDFKEGVLISIKGLTS